MSQAVDSVVPFLLHLSSSFPGCKLLSQTAYWSCHSLIFTAVCCDNALGTCRRVEVLSYHSGLQRGYNGCAAAAS